MEFQKWWNKLLCSNDERLRLIAQSAWKASRKNVLDAVLTELRLGCDLEAHVKKELEKLQ
jgi:hypothetical protein